MRTVHFNLPVVDLTGNKGPVAAYSAGAAAGVWMDDYVERVVCDVHVAGSFQRIPSPFHVWSAHAPPWQKVHVLINNNQC